MNAIEKLSKRYDKHHMGPKTLGFTYEEILKAYYEGRKDSLENMRSHAVVLQKAGESNKSLRLDRLRRDRK